MEGGGVSVGLVAFVSALLMGTGLRRQPGLGVLGAVAVVGLVLWAHGGGVTALGFAAPTPIEEAIFRGFLMTEIARIVGTSPWATVLNVVLASVVFGLAHGSPGRSGVVSTGLVAAFLGWVFIASDHDLWLVIVTHGFIDTVGIALIATGADDALRRRLWGASE